MGKLRLKRVLYSETNNIRLKRKLYGIGDGVGDVLSATGDVAKNVANTGIDVTKKMGGAAVEGVGKATNFVGDTAGGIVSGTGKVLQAAALPLAFIPGVGMAAGAVSGLTGLAMDGVGSLAKKAVHTVGDTVQNAGQSIMY